MIRTRIKAGSVAFADGGGSGGFVAWLIRRKRINHWIAFMDDGASHQPSRVVLFAAAPHGRRPAPQGVRAIE
jgi:hypothetical protein